MDYKDFYKAIVNPLSGLQDDTIDALIDLFNDVESLKAPGNAQQQVQPDGADKPLAG
jgi:hypothetical protein